MHGLGAAAGGSTGLQQAEVPDFVLPDEPGESGANVLRPAVDARRTHARDEVDVEVGLGVDHHLVPQRGQCLASGPKGNDLRIEIERDANPSIVKTHLDDVDEADLLKGKTDNSARDTFFYNSGTKPLAIRYKNWKMY